MRLGLAHFHRLGKLNGSIINSCQLQFPGKTSRVKRVLLEKEEGQEGEDKLI